MPRRALIATIVTGAIGALMGLVLGGVVGRVIALFGDETVQSSVPMVFCGTLGFFVGGPSAIKGSLERFGAKRAALGTAVAAVIVIVLVGGASVSRMAGVIVLVVGVISVIVAAAAATAVSQPGERPVVATPARGSSAAAPVAAPAPAPTAAPEPVVTAAEPARPRAAEAARRVVVEHPEPEPEVLADWQPEDASTEAPDEAVERPAPRRATAARKAPANRPRRDRPLRKGDA